MTEKDYIPLFLNIAEGLGVFIIDDNLIGCLNSLGSLPHSGKSFDLLHQLYANKSIQNSFPDQLRSFFESDKTGLHEKDIPESCLIGELDRWYFYCLKVAVSINEDSSFPVLISNFRYSHRIMDFIQLNYEVKLTATDAFLLFSNLCTNSQCAFFSTYLRNNQEIAFNKQALKKEITKRLETLKEPKYHFRWSTLYNNFMLFSLEYVDYLRVSIDEGKISPQTILRLSGAPILAFLINYPVISNFAKEILKELLENQDELSLNQKVIYLTFLSQINKSQFTEYIAPYDEKISKTLAELNTSLLKPMPIDSFK
ncbi:MAG: hypothetical protein ACTSO7_17325 [Candidatus Heimdallarchaeota archaeon]